MSKSLLLDQLIPADCIELGRLVLNVRYPDQDFYDPETPLESNNDSVSRQRFDSFSHLASSTNDSGFHAFLSSLLSGTRNKHDETKIDISAAVCTTRQLRNPAKYFQSFCEAEEKARTWLDQAIQRRQSVYLVTGIKTVTDATVGAVVARGSNGDVSSQVPTTLIGTAAAGMPIPGVDALDLGASINSSRKVEQRTGFVALGEQVFAVQYRKIRFARFWENKFENVRLGDSVRWNMYLGIRATDQEAEGNMVDASLSKTLDEEDLEEEGIYRSSFLESEEYFYPVHSL